MIYCEQCSSEQIAVQKIDTMSPTYFQSGDRMWSKLDPPVEDSPLIEFWCRDCDHSWEMSGTLEDVLAGIFDEEPDEDEDDVLGHEEG